MKFFDNLFDFNHDGKLDSFEKEAQFVALTSLIDDANEEDKAREEEENSDSELSSAGLDIDELESMDEDERRDTIEDAELDPDDYDLF